MWSELLFFIMTWPLDLIDGPSEVMAKLFMLELYLFQYIFLWFGRDERNTCDGQIYKPDFYLPLEQYSKILKRQNCHLNFPFNPCALEISSSCGY
jgi:hypothetical protein